MRSGPPSHTVLASASASALRSSKPTTARSAPSARAAVGPASSSTCPSPRMSLMRKPTAPAADPAPIVYVIDDDPSVRAALEDLLASMGLQVRAFASTQAFLDHELEDAPACLVLEVRMPGQSGLEFHRSMGTHGLQLPVVFITGHGDIAMGVNAIKDGAIEFLTKPFRDQELLDAIHKGIEIDRQRRRDGEALDALQQRWNTLNAGEREVVDGVVRGRLNKQIAGDLAVSEITVKVRRAQVMRKMGARTLVDLVRMYDRLQAGSP
ncbi:hypothetical protein G6F60_013553 [Rhizopus arrhizus]|nr:hypothetical protein G6F60_013553 [Rhizopus arrhizus]